MPEPPKRAPIANAPLSVVLPLRNGSADVAELVDAWQPVLQGLKRDTELIVVAEGTTTLAADVPVRLVTEAGGLGAAIRAGLAAAQHPLVLFASDDRRYAPANLKRLLAEIDKNDLVWARRKDHAASGLLGGLGKLYRISLRVLFGIPFEAPPPWLGFKPRLFHWLLRVWTGARAADINCPFKLYRRDVLARIPIQSDGPFVHGEILAKANFLECPLTEVEIAGPADDPAQDLRPLLREMWDVLCDPDFRKPTAATPRPEKKKKKRKLK